MPAYVFGYGNLDGPWKVDFRDVPTLVLNRYGADLHSGCLRSLGIHVGDHHCNFAVEELNGGEFAIVCPTHPKHVPDCSEFRHDSNVVNV